MTLVSPAIAETANGALKRVPVLPLYFLALVPAAWLIYRALHGDLGADPVRALEQGLGLWAFRFMLATLAVTPLRRFLGIALLRFRRMLGLTVFWYVLLHLAVWLVLDRQMIWRDILPDLFKRPYIVVGMLALLSLIPLAITSHDAMVRRLGALRWRKLHRLAYPAGILMALHYLWLVKSWTAEPLTYAALMFLLLALRFLPDASANRARRARAPA
jgi:sulfoxide reductase heme-binding subunit YedZ